jgi:hypothetical protein
MATSSADQQNANASVHLRATLRSLSTLAAARDRQLSGRPATNPPPAIYVGGWYSESTRRIGYGRRFRVDARCGKRVRRICSITGNARRVSAATSGTEVDVPKGQIADVPLTGAGCNTRPHDQFSQHSSNRKLSANGTEVPVLGNDRIPEIRGERGMQRDTDPPVP